MDKLDVLPETGRTDYVTKDTDESGEDLLLSLSTNPPPLGASAGYSNPLSDHMFAEYNIDTRDQNWVGNRELEAFKNSEISKNKAESEKASYNLFNSFNKNYSSLNQTDDTSLVSDIDGIRDNIETVSSKEKELETIKNFDWEGAMKASQNVSTIKETKPNLSSSGALPYVIKKQERGKRTTEISSPDIFNITGFGKEDNGTLGPTLKVSVGHSGFLKEKGARRQLTDLEYNPKVNPDFLRPNIMKLQKRDVTGPYEPGNDMSDFRTSFLYDTFATLDKFQSAEGVGLKEGLKYQIRHNRFDQEISYAAKLQYNFMQKNKLPYNLTNVSKAIKNVSNYTEHADLKALDMRNLLKKGEPEYKYFYENERKKFYESKGLDVKDALEEDYIKNKFVDNTAVFNNEESRLLSAEQGFQNYWKSIPRHTDKRVYFMQAKFPDGTGKSYNQKMIESLNKSVTVNGKKQIDLRIVIKDNHHHLAVSSKRGAQPSAVAKKDGKGISRSIAEKGDPFWDDTGYVQVGVTEDGIAIMEERTDKKKTKVIVPKEQNITIDEPINVEGR
jgi:hypothetical protein